MTLPLAFLVGCTPEQAIEQLYPTMAISPSAISFGELGLYDENVPQAVTVKNEGSAKLTVTGELQGSPAFTVDAPIDLEIAAGDSAEIPITFTPDTFKSYEGTLVLHSNDTDHADATVPVTGKAIDKPYPDIDIEPARTVALPQLDPGATGLFHFEIHNVGSAPLDLDAFSFDPPDAQYSLGDYDLTGQTVAPGDFTTAYVEYDPTSSEGSHVIVHIESNDPDEADTTVLLLGNGGGDWPLPIANISCPSTILLSGPQTTHIDGLPSTDPSGFEPLTYQWTVTERPEGSDVTGHDLDPDDTPAIDLYTDIAGEWQVQLVVTNQLGTQSLPATCTMLAKPADAIHVELTWDTPSSDLDLHLTEGGYAIFDQPEDCFYCNKVPDWGANGSDDDPRLDIDDQGGFGPENINIYQPVSGTYDVEVHYFAPHGDKTSIAHVAVWLDGTNVWEGDRAMDSNDVWSVGTIDYTPPDYVLFTEDPNPDNTKGGPTGCGG